MKVKWNMSNGYIMNIPDFSFEVDANEFIDYDDEGELTLDIEEMVKQDFFEHVSYYVTNMDEIIAEIKKTRGVTTMSKELTTGCSWALDTVVSHLVERAMAMNEIGEIEESVALWGFINALQGEPVSSDDFDEMHERSYNLGYEILGSLKEE